jgi:hypothetical protein
MNTRIGPRIALLVSVAVLVATALPAAALPPTTFPVEGAQIQVVCGSDYYVGTGNGSFTRHDRTKGSRFGSQVTFHIVWEFVNESDASDTFTYIDTGVAHGWVDGEGHEIFSVSGHTTARPGDGALQHGRWVKFNDDVWTNRGHTTGCTLVVPEPEPWMEIIPFEGHLVGHNFPPEQDIEYQLPGGAWTLAGQGNLEGDLEIQDVFVPGTIVPGDVVRLRSAVDHTIVKQIAVVDLTYDSLDTNLAEGRAVGLTSDQLLFCYEADCVNPNADGTTWSVDPLANGMEIDLGSIPSFINYFDADGDAQQVVDPYFLP